MSDDSKDVNSPSRKMAVILAADVVGYSKLMESNEKLTLKNLKESRKVIDKVIKNNNGRIFNTAGDSVMAEFASPVEAVESAFNFQNLLKEQNNNNKTPNPILFRVGINLGDVMIEGNNLFGDNVNIASRLESISKPEQICISEKVYQEVHNKVDINFYPLGEKKLKNIANKIKVFSTDTSRKETSERSNVFTNLLSKNIFYILLLLITLILIALYFSKNFLSTNTDNYIQDSSSSVLETFKTDEQSGTSKPAIDTDKIIIAVMKFDNQDSSNIKVDYTNELLQHTIDNLTDNKTIEIVIVPKGSENLNPPEVMLIATESNASFILNGVIYEENNNPVLSLKLYEARRGTNINNQKILLVNDEFKSFDKALRKIYDSIKKIGK